MRNKVETVDLTRKEVDTAPSLWESSLSPCQVAFTPLHSPVNTHWLTYKRIWWRLEHQDRLDYMAMTPKSEWLNKGSLFPDHTTSQVQQLSSSELLRNPGWQRPHPDMLSMMTTQMKGPPGLKLVIKCPSLKVASITSTQSSWVEPFIR